MHFRTKSLVIAFSFFGSFQALAQGSYDEAKAAFTQSCGDTADAACFAATCVELLDASGEAAAREICDAVVNEAPLELNAAEGADEAADAHAVATACDGADRRAGEIVFVPQSDGSTVPVECVEADGDGTVGEDGPIRRLIARIRGDQPQPQQPSPPQMQHPFGKDGIALWRYNLQGPYAFLIDIKRLFFVTWK